jgi:hypothetical protein
MQIYFEKLMGVRPIAVRFANIKQADIFYQAMKSEFPERVKGWWKPAYPVRYEKEGGVCYCPYFNEEYGFMTHGSKLMFTENRRYEVIEFEELLYYSEVEIDDADLPLEFLFA